MGRDPARGTIIPLFTPPPGFSPAAVRFVERLGFDHKAFAAAVVDMAVKGYLLIQEDGGRIHPGTEGRRHDLSRGEHKIADRLFGGGRKSLKLTNDNHTTIKGAIDALKGHPEGGVRKEILCHQLHVPGARDYHYPGNLGSIVVFAMDTAAAAFGSLWLLIWTVVCYFLAVMVYRRWQVALGGGFKLGNLLSAVGTTIFAGFFFAGEIPGSGMLVGAVSLPAVLLLAAMGLVNALVLPPAQGPHPVRAQDHGPDRGVQDVSLGGGKGAPGGA